MLSHTLRQAQSDTARVVMLSVVETSVVGNQQALFLIIFGLVQQLWAFNFQILDLYGY
jgi:hypothetical protein